MDEPIHNPVAFPWLLDSWGNTKKSLARQYPHLPTPPAIQSHSGSFTLLNDLELCHFKGTTRLFHGMIAPLVPYAIRGVAWYQGESDQGQAWQYRTLFPAMIEDWRNHWERTDLPVLFVMLPGYGKPHQGYTYELRDAQLHTHRKVPHTGMVVAVDLGDEREVHPPNKQPVGERLGILARSMVYGEAITPTGPLLRRAEFAQGRAVIEFDHVGDGLVQRGEALAGFTMAGEDRLFHQATRAHRR